MPISWQTLGLMGATDVMASKAMALTLKPHGLGREMHSQQTIHQYITVILFYI